MTTTFYLPASGTPPLASLAVDSQWEYSNGISRLPCFTSKQNTALATTIMQPPTVTGTYQWVWFQYQSQHLQTDYTWTTTDTVSVVIGKCAETTTSGDAHLAYSVRVVNWDGSIVRGTIGLYHATSSELPLTANAATRIHNARVNGATNFNSYAGDRIIIELGLHVVTPAIENMQMRKGDPTAIADFALTAGLTTDLCPWVRLSRTVTLGDTSSSTTSSTTSSSTSSSSESYSTSTSSTTSSSTSCTSSSSSSTTSSSSSESYSTSTSSTTSSSTSCSSSSSFSSSESSSSSSSSSSSISFWIYPWDWTVESTYVGNYKSSNFVNGVLVITDTSINVSITTYVTMDWGAAGRP
jgi:hypothetical protein